MPLRLIQNELDSGTLTVEFAALNETQFVSFEDCLFSDIRFVILERMIPARSCVIKFFFRCTFAGSSFDLPDDVGAYLLEFSQCQFNDVPFLPPLPEDRQPILDLWDQNTFGGKVDSYNENPEDATDFDRWSRKSSPYLRRKSVPD